MSQFMGEGRKFLCRRLARQESDPPATGDSPGRRDSSRIFDGDALRGGKTKQLVAAVARIAFDDADLRQLLTIGLETNRALRTSIRRSGLVDAHECGVLSAAPSLASMALTQYSNALSKTRLPIQLQGPPGFHCFGNKVFSAAALNEKSLEHVNDIPEFCLRDVSCILRAERRNEAVLAVRNRLSMFARRSATTFRRFYEISDTSCLPKFVS